MKPDSALGHDDLLDAIKARRDDPAFMARLRERVEQDAPILERLASEPGWAVCARCEHFSGEHGHDGKCYVLPGCDCPGYVMVVPEGDGVPGPNPTVLPSEASTDA